MKLVCCDREAIAFVATPYSTSGVEVRRLIRKSVYARFGDVKPEPPVQWLSDNESIYTSLETLIEAERHHLVPITTPVASPESNGMAESFVNTFKRDYVAGGDVASAARVIEQVPGWIEDYNTFAPRSALGMMTPAEFRRRGQAARNYPAPESRTGVDKRQLGSSLLAPHLVQLVVLGRIHRRMGAFTVPSWRQIMTLSTLVRSHLILCASAAMLLLPARTARAQCDAPTTCMPPPACPYTSLSVVSFPNGGQISNLRLHDPSVCIPPPPPGGTTSSSFGILVDVSYAGPEGTGVVFDALTDGLIVLRRIDTNPLGDHYETEIGGIGVAGGSLPPGVMIRESPTRRSEGQTTIKPVTGGYQIDSFFDVFTELSVDNGQTWLPSDQPIRATAKTPGSTPVRASTWGALKVTYR